jgi:ribose-phosphate pyrophosphokinase
MGLLYGLGVDDLIVVDAHNENSLKMIEEQFSMNALNVSAIPLLAEELQRRGFEGAYSLSPDKGALHLAEAAAEVLGGSHSYFEKSRDRRTGEIEMKVEDLDISGRKVVVFDDIISSGRTTASAVEALMAQGAFKVAAACSHALLIGDAMERINNAGADLIIATDTVQKGVCDVTVSVAPLIGKALRAL